jgi:hypothetical protein
MPNKISKDELRLQIAEQLQQVLNGHNEEAGKKVNKTVANFSEKLAAKFKKTLKKVAIEANKAANKTKRAEDKAVNKLTKKASKDKK